LKLQFNTNGNAKQKQACIYWGDNQTTEIVYGGSKGSGKSYLGCSLIFGNALTWPETHYFIAREALNDLRKYTIPSIYEVFQHWGIGTQYYTFNGQDNVFNLYNGSKVFLLEAKYYPGDPLFERFGSMQMTQGWIEEAGQISEDAKNNLSASIGRWKNNERLPAKLLQTCNPAKNYLYKYYKQNKEGVLPGHVKFIQALPQDNNMAAAGYYEHLERTLSKNQKQRLLFGNWEYDDDPAALCDYEKIIEMFSNEFHPLAGKKYITCDVARFGSDKIVIGLWNGFRVKIYTFEKQSIVQSYKFVDELRRKESIPLNNVIADEDGVGGGLVDMLKCKGFLNNGRPLKDENYINLQSQCAFKLAERINANGIYIEGVEGKEQELIIEELEQLKQKDMDKDGKKAIVSKDQVKAILGRSPDYRDMLLMREWFELSSRGSFDYGIGSF
jgi:phage terminase large subunit